MPESRQVTAEGGIQYFLLENNDYQEYDVYHHSVFDVDEITNDGFKVHYFTVSCEEIRNQHLPNTANPRDPAAGGVVSEMQQTLSEHPARFYQFNGGITISCTSVTEITENERFRIDFGNKDGICNGGHTYFSIQTFPEEIDQRDAFFARGG